MVSHFTTDRQIKFQFLNTSLKIYRHKVLGLSSLIATKFNKLPCKFMGTVSHFNLFKRVKRSSKLKNSKSRLYKISRIGPKCQPWLEKNPITCKKFKTQKLISWQIALISSLSQECVKVTLSKSSTIPQNRLSFPTKSLFLSSIVSYWP